MSRIQAAFTQRGFVLGSEAFADLGAREYATLASEGAMLGATDDAGHTCPLVMRVYPCNEMGISVTAWVPVVESLRPTAKQVVAALMVAHGMNPRDDG